MENSAYKGTSSALKEDVHTTLSESLGEYENRLSDLASRAHALADRVAGSRPTEVQGAGLAGPGDHLVMRASGLRGLIASCEDSLSRIDNAVG